ncbi:MAG: putative addiction module antidote protein, partial [Acidimicrobiaceae bacterium]|nr:putative addiction module antidote protein [Acidimicrobiaceae bacterium]
METWDAAEYLQTKQDVIAYLDAALVENDPQLVTAALGDIARSKGMATVAADSGLGRESLYKSMSENGNPEFA